MIERIEGMSVAEQREYLEAENKAYDTLLEAGYLPYGNEKTKWRTISVFEKVKPGERSNYIGEYKNFQEAADRLVTRRRMSKIYIVVENGVVNSVYTDSKEELEVILCDYDNAEKETENDQYGFECTNNIKELNENIEQLYSIF